MFIDYYKENWFRILSNVKYALNIVENAFIKVTFFEILYDVKFRKMLQKFTIFIKQNKNVINFLKNRQQFCSEIYDVIKLTQVKITLIFDNKHQLFNLIDSIYIKLIKSKRLNYYISNASFFSFKKIDFFKIIKKMSDLIYKLKLSISMRIHNVIFVIHLKQILLNSHVKTISFLLLLIVEG